MISILCPSRGRPQFARDLLESIRATAAMQATQLVLRLDDDDPTFSQYADLVTGSDVTTVVGPRVVLSQCWNEAAAKAQWDVLMLCGDDIRFRSPNWDHMVMDAIWSVPDRILLVHGRDGIQDSRVATHPFMHRRWMETVGYFVPPIFASDYNDLWLTQVADMIGRRRFIPEIYTEHLHPVVGKHYLDQTHQERLLRGQLENVDQLYRDTEAGRYADADKLRAVIGTTTRPFPGPSTPTRPDYPGAVMSQPDQNQTPATVDYDAAKDPANPASWDGKIPGEVDTDTGVPVWIDPEEEPHAFDDTEWADDAADLKGQALDEALESAGLSKSGTADEKRARLAEYQAGSQ